MLIGRDQPEMDDFPIFQVCLLEMVWHTLTSIYAESWSQDRDISSVLIETHLLEDAGMAFLFSGICRRGFHPQTTSGRRKATTDDFVDEVKLELQLKGTANN